MKIMAYMKSILEWNKYILSHAYKRSQIINLLSIKFRYQKKSLKKVKFRIIAIFLNMSLIKKTILYLEQNLMKFKNLY